MEEIGDKVFSRRDFTRFCMTSAGTLLLTTAFFSETAEAFLRVGDILPKVSLPDLKGNRVTLPNDFAGKVILIHFWASWCPFCVKEMIAIESIYSIYKEKGVIPFSINVGENSRAVEAYVTKIRVSYPILLDTQSGAARGYGITGIPTTLLCDRNGVIQFKVLGEVNQDGLRRILAHLI